MRLADPAILSLLQEGLPTRREPTFDREALRASVRMLCRPSFSFSFTSYSSRSYFLMLGPNNVPTRRNHNRPPARGEYRTKSRYSDFQR